MANLRAIFNQTKLEFSLPKDKNSNVIIVDGLNTFIRVFSAVPVLNDDGQHVGGVVGFLRSVGANIRQFQATRCIIVFDGKGGSQRRKKIFPEYKAGRINKNKLNRFDEFKDIVDEQESMKIQFKRLVEYLDILPVTLICIDNIEADDVIAYIAKQYYEDIDNKITIVSSDRDFIQLVDHKINVWSPVKKVLFTPEVVAEKYENINNHNYLLYRILTGDASDNIDGVPGIGLKTLIKRVPQITEGKMSVDELYEYCSKKVEEKSKPQVYFNILSNKELISRNEKLMQLFEVDISGNSKLRIMNKMDEDIVFLDKLKFKQLFLYDKLFANIKDVDSWLRDTFSKLNVYATRKIK